MTVEEIQEKATTNLMVGWVKLSGSGVQSSSKWALVLEGKDDLAFYPHYFRITADNEFEIITGGNKDGVLACYDKAKKEPRFDNLKALFFVDRDIDDYLSQGRKSCKKLYITPNYSFENFLCTQKCFEIYLQDHVIGITKAEIKSYQEAYEIALLSFAQEFSKYIAYGIVNKKTRRFDFCNLHFSRNYSISKSLQFNLKSQFDARKLDEHFEYNKPTSIYEVRSLRSKLLADKTQKWIRGKDFLRFFSEFLKVSMSLETEKEKECRRKPSPQDLIESMPAKLKIPSCLKQHIENK